MPRAGSPTRLVIVESPNKAKTIAGYLGDGYIVESSIGHIRDLPRGAGDIPAKYKGKPWARLGVDTDNGFVPLYIVTPDKKSQVARLKKLLAEASELLLATDEDREGEAIAWHLLETLKPKVPVKRMVFHEITRQAIADAVANPRELNIDLVDAQETRRILDRLYGYEVSPVLWKKVMPKLSAGRVQSVATRLVVERERARMAFVSGTYWGLEAVFATLPPSETARLQADLVSVNDQRLASGKDFDDATGTLKSASSVLLLDEDAAANVARSLAGQSGEVISVEEKPYTRRPYAPFITSTLQQEAGRKLGFSTERTMRTAQRLYEHGYITYMRTDSTTLSQTALDAARAQARELYGADYVPASPRRYVTKSKNAQEAHEAIRPAGESFRTPREVAGALSSDEFRLYELIWQRTVASQMVDAKGSTASVRIAATADSAECVFAASGRTITFPGFLRAYVETIDSESGGEADDAERKLPTLTVGQRLSIGQVECESHATNPPPRFTEPSLIKTLDEQGIGRPSTYASIIRTITDRGYVWRKGNALVPSWIAFAVVGLLEGNFPWLVDYSFTAEMEDVLDQIAGGNLDGKAALGDFYFGSADSSADGMAGQGGLKQVVANRLEGIDAREVNSLPLVKDAAGTQVYVRVGRYGPYLERTGPDGESQRANLSENLPPDEVNAAKVDELFAAGAGGGERELGIDPATGATIVAKDGRYGPYVTEVTEAPKTGKGAAKPRTASLFKTMTLATVELEDALRLLSLPRTVGTDPANGEAITAQNGRYGPYLLRGKESRSLSDEEAMFTVTLDEALALFAQPKTRGRAAAAAPLRELGDDPATGAPVQLKEGRFGPYVTDGTTNASLRKADDPESITLERAAELLADRRERGPAKPRRKTAAKKPATRTRKKAT